jgi:hypothetical protein
MLGKGQNKDGFNGDYPSANRFTPSQVKAGYWLSGDGMLSDKWDSRLLSRLALAPHRAFSGRSYVKGT